MATLIITPPLPLHTCAGAADAKRGLLADVPPKASEWHRSPINQCSLFAVAQGSQTSHPCKPLVTALHLRPPPPCSRHESDGGQEAPVRRSCCWSQTSSMPQHGGSRHADGFRPEGVSSQPAAAQGACASPTVREGPVQAGGPIRGMCKARVARGACPAESMLLFAGVQKTCAQETASKQGACVVTWVIGEQAKQAKEKQASDCCGQVADEPARSAQPRKLSFSVCRQPRTAQR